MNRLDIIEMLSESITKSHDKIAIEWRENQLSYDELEIRASQIAARLNSAGAGKGSLIVVMLENSFHVIPAIIGILQAGCVFVPIDHTNPEKRLEAMFSVIKPEWVITESKFAALLERFLPPTQNKLPLIQLYNGEVQPAHHEEAPGLSAAVPPASTQKILVTNEPDDMCCIYFTSGSTGNPKAIAGRFKSIAHFIDWEIKTFNIDETVRVGQFTNHAFDAFLRDVFVPLCVGGTICIPDERETILETMSFIRWIDERRISLIHCVPTLFRMILSQELKPEYFSHLKYIMLAGEKVYPADIKKWMEIYADRVQLVNFYGPTETTMIKFFHPINPSDLERKFIPIGKPMEGARAVVVGPDGKACPPNSVGEIYIRTPYRSLGYYNEPELTKEFFVQNPFSDDPLDIVYKTGDLGRVLSDGNFEFLGRKDYQVKIRGLRVELGEIETLLRTFAGVRDAVVIEAKDAREEPYLCAYVAADQGLETNELRDHLLTQLPANMVPSVFMKLEALPLTLNGKVDRRALPPPEKKRSKQTAFVAPRTLTEETLASTWSDLLGVEQVGINDNFFELGGHSLLATQLISRLRIAFQVELPLAALFENPTVAKLAILVTQSHMASIGNEDVSRLLDELEQLSDESVRSNMSSQTQLK